MTIEPTIEPHGCIFHACRDAKTEKHRRVKKSEFDALFKNGAFSDGPYTEGFGDGYGEPYNPRRQAFGVIGDEVVWCCLHPDEAELEGVSV